MHVHVYSVQHISIAGLYFLNVRRLPLLAIPAHPSIRFPVGPLSGETAAFRVGPTDPETRDASFLTMTIYKAL